MIVGVLVEVASSSVDKIFDYFVPSSMESSIRVGVRVLVPFGRRTIEGFVLEIKSSSTLELKEVIEVIDTDVILNQELLELGKEVQKNTLSTLISAYQVMLPKALKAKAGRKITKKYDVYYQLLNKEYEAKNPSQKKILELFLDRDVILRSKLVDISKSSLDTLVTKGVLGVIKKEVYRTSYQVGKKEVHTLTLEQQKVVDTVLEGDSSKPYLLFGVTGSGKTEVYMQIIEEALREGKTAIMLVPEISLTPQMIERFSNRFPHAIAALHSALSDGEKYDEWRRIARGEASIVIGARSAIFAPLKNIGAIIMDEEHSDSYKQGDSSPRYHARDIAIWRGKYHQCPVILGSATPSLESMARAGKGVYQLLTLDKRVNGRNLPKVSIIDMNLESRRQGHFSSALIQAILSRLEKKNK